MFLLYVGFIAFLMILGPVVSYVEVLPPVVGFAVFALGVGNGLVGFLVSVYLLTKKRTNVALVGVLLIPVVIVAAGMRSVTGYPRINDISTDLVNPPKLRITQQAPVAEFDDATIAIHRDHYGDLKSKHVAGDIAQIKQKIKQAIGARRDLFLSWEDDQSLHAYLITGVFKFRNDIVFRFQQENERVKVDIRSRSQSGKSDLGVNANLIRWFMQQI